MPRPRKPANPFRYFNSSPEVIRLVVVMMCVRFPLTLRYVEDLLFERGIDVCHETVRMCEANLMIGALPSRKGAQWSHRTIFRNFKRIFR